MLATPGFRGGPCGEKICQNDLSGVGELLVSFRTRQVGVLIPGLEKVIGSGTQNLLKSGGYVNIPGWAANSCLFLLKGVYIAFSTTGVGSHGQRAKEEKDCFS
jgi:hypothetical protein